MSPEPDQDADRSVLSWESVLDASGADPSTARPADDSPVPSAASAAPASPPAAPVNDIELTIAPLSLDPLTLDPPPAIPESPAADRADVLGDLHLELPPLEIPPLDLDGPAARVASPAPAAPPPAAAPTAGVASPPAPDSNTDDAPVFEMIDLTIEPLDVPDIARPPAPPAAPSVSAAPAPAAPAPAPVRPAPEPAAPASASTTAASIEPAPTPAAFGAVSAPAPAHVSAEVPAIPGLPADPVSTDSTPTTVIAQMPGAQSAPPVFGAASAAAAVNAPAVATPSVAAPSVAAPSVAAHSIAAPSIGGAEIPVATLPNHQPNQANRPAPAAASEDAEPAEALSRSDRKHQAKLKKQEQKQALRAAKGKGTTKPQRSGGGLALFFTLLVLGGLIAGAIVYGQPYLFPDKWDDVSRPYGEAVEIARGVDIIDPIYIQRQEADAFATGMTADVVGPWEDQAPTWRSLGLLSGAVDATLLGQLVADWNSAYYSPRTSEIIANDSAPAAILDSAIAEAMAAGAADQETDWVDSIDEAMLDASALTRGSVISSSRIAAADTSFGAADRSVRDVAVSTYLPPVLEYRVNAPETYAELAAGNEAALQAVAAAGTLQASSEPELTEGDTIVSSQQVPDRTFWYLTFASYTDARTAYDASNALVQASLASADNVATTCTYATFSGTDVDGTALLAGVMQQWVANVPAAMNASVSTLANGTMQLRTCDPGAGFETGARFGIGREIARLRAVEIAAVAAAPATDAAGSAAAIATVRAAGTGLPILGLDLAATAAQTATEATNIADAAQAAAAPPAADGE